MPDLLVKVIFVCHANVCRSPLAEALFTHLVERQGLGGRIAVDSAGTWVGTVGLPPDARMVRLADRQGITMAGLRARQLLAADLAHFDLVLCMDRQVEQDVQYLDPERQFREGIRLFRSFDPEPGNGEVPDPYLGKDADLERAYHIIDRTTRALLMALTEPLSSR